MRATSTPPKTPQIRAFDVVVPEGKVWVMGDNRNHSADSRAHLDSNGGFVDLADVEGKAAVIAWPLNRITVLDNYPDVFRERARGAVAVIQQSHRPRRSRRRAGSGQRPRSRQAADPPARADLQGAGCPLSGRRRRGGPRRTGRAGERRDRRRRP